MEESSSHGRLNLAVRTGGHVYLFEFKVVEMALPGSALAQLGERDYAARYRPGGEPIHLIGVKFIRETPNATAFEVADCQPPRAPVHGARSGSRGAAPETSLAARVLEGPFGFDAGSTARS